MSPPIPPSLPVAVEDAHRQISCPPGTQTSCNAFNNLLEHNDPDILDYVHPKDHNAHIHACLSTEGENKFFVVKYNPSSKGSRRATFLMLAFENGVQHNTELATLRWISEDFGEISALLKAEDQSGSISTSELDYSRSFVNLNGTMTNYSLAVRWSTGTYIERYSWPDKKGEAHLTTNTGSCVQLN